jgi:hypothetical protein
MHILQSYKMRLKQKIRRTCIQLLTPLTQEIIAPTIAALTDSVPSSKRSSTPKFGFGAMPIDCISPPAVKW